MIEITKDDRYLYLTYYYDESSFAPNRDWIVNDLQRKGVVHLANRTFTLTPELLKDGARPDASEEEFFEQPNITFKIAERLPSEQDQISGEFYKIYPNVLISDKDIFLHRDMECDIRYFVAETNISIFRQIAELTSDPMIVIGGTSPLSIPLQEFYQLIKNFPTTYEKRLYAQARIASILRDYFQDFKDAQSQFVAYRNKKPSTEGANLTRIFKDYEAEKFQTIYDKLLNMLQGEEGYNENQWQQEIVDILILLYPKYIAVFSEVPIHVDGTKKRLDFLFVDANGHVDVVEIKQPFAQVIMTKRLHRGNHIPLSELSGTVMQLEKYIYHLNRWGDKGEKYLTERYEDLLPPNFNIQITNPKGFIIMGRENNLDSRQKKDFEVVKRKYRNIVDILTYDDLLQRLKFIINQIKTK